MSFPRLVFEWSPTTNPFQTPVWTEMVDSQGFDVLRSYKIKRGRQKWLDRPQAGTGTFTLRNRDGSLTFGSANPNIGPIKRCRIRAIVGGTSYTRWTGYFNSLALSWTRDESQVTAQTYDGLALLAIGNQMAPYPLTAMSYAPYAYYRTQEGTGATIAFDASGNSQNGSYIGSPVFGVASPIADTQAKAIATLVSSGGYLASAPLAAIAGTASFSFACWVNSVPTGSGIASLASSPGWSSSPTIGEQFQLTIDSNTFTGGPASLGDGNWHLVGFTRDTVGGTGTTYVDGAAVNSGPLGTLMTYLQAQVLFGPAGLGGLAEPAFFAPLTSAQFAALFAAGPGWAGMASGTRIATLLGVMGWNSADESIDTGSTLLASADDLANSSALQHILDASSPGTEAGLAFIDMSGRLRFISRWSLQAAPYNVSQATFGDAGGGEISYNLAGLQPVVDDIDIWNVIKNARKGGATVYARASQAQIAKYGPPREQDLTSIANSDEAALAAAQWELLQDQAAIQRIEQMALTGYDANYVSIFGRELGDLITIKGSPPNTGGGRISQLVRILGMSESADANSRKLQATWNLWPKEPQMLMVSDPTYGFVGGSGFAGATTVIGY